MSVKWKTIAVTVAFFAEQTSFELKFFTQIDEKDFVPEELADGFMIRFKGYNVALHLRNTAFYYTANEPDGEKEEQLESSLAMLKLFRTAINELRALKNQQGGEDA